MKEMEQADDKVVRVPLPPEEWFWLRRLQAITGDEPSAMIASMLRAIRIDDEQAHEENDDGRQH
jgi:hypothetical protein